MAVDYDLVVIGSSWAGIYAAKKAVGLQARVALVTQCDDLFLPNDTLIIHSISEIGQLNHQLANNPFTTTSSTIADVSLSQAGNWAKGIESVMQNNSLSSLAALGVDVIADRGEFCRLPQLAFQVAKRKLRSRSFLVATGSNFVTPVDKNTNHNYLTLRELGDRDLSSLGKNLIVVGSDPIALELTQSLARFDKKVTLVVEKPRILPQEDLDIALLIQAQLEAEGVEVYTNSKISQIKLIDEQKWLQAGDRAIAADEIIFADRRQPNITGLNLAGVEVKYDRQKILVNQKLQTTNPNIYACGDAIGGYSLPNIARHEVNIILKNTLFFPWYKINYHSVPWAVLTQPNLARVGLTEHQARQQDKDIYVIKQYFDSVALAQITDRTTGVCKLLVREDGEILGCSLVGDRAGELISIIAGAIEHKIKLDRNPMRGLTSPSIPAIYPSMNQIFQQAIDNFYQQKLQRNPKLLNRLRSWFSMRKSWHK